VNLIDSNRESECSTRQSMCSSVGFHIPYHSSASLDHRHRHDISHMGVCRLSTITN